MAGRKRSEVDGRFNLFAVGDGDPSIYALAGALGEFIHRYEDYQAKLQYLFEYYRSAANIIEAANALIAGHAVRMTETQPIRIDNARRDLRAEANSSGARGPQTSRLENGNAKPVKVPTPPAAFATCQ